MILQIYLRKKEVLRGVASKGFTLIELLIVSVIILALISFSTPLFRKSFSDLELKETASRISKFITFAQQEAIVKQVNYKIKFGFGKKTYQLLAWTITEVEGQEREKYLPITGRFGRIFYIPQGIDIEGRFDEILFYPDGHCDNGIPGLPEQVSLTLTNKNKKVLTITTTGTLGNVIIEEEK